MKSIKHKSLPDIVNELLDASLAYDQESEKSTEITRSHRYYREGLADLIDLAYKQSNMGIMEVCRNTDDLFSPDFNCGCLRCDLSQLEGSLLGVEGKVDDYGVKWKAIAPFQKKRLNKIRRKYGLEDHFYSDCCE